MKLPPDEVDRWPRDKAELGRRRALVRSQYEALGAPAREIWVTCPCGKWIGMIAAYKCFECGVWLCEVCAKRHFGSQGRPTICTPSPTGPACDSEPACRSGKPDDAGIVLGLSAAAAHGRPSSVIPGKPGKPGDDQGPSFTGELTYPPRAFRMRSDHLACRRKGFGRGFELVYTFILSPAGVPDLVAIKWRRRFTWYDPRSWRQAWRVIAKSADDAETITEGA